MRITPELLRKYAELIVRTGANVQPGQVVQLTVSVEQHEFAALITEECYKAGAAKVNVNWLSDAQNRLNCLYADQEVLSKVLPWEEAKMKQMTEDLPCRIFIESEDPDALSGIDPDKISAVSRSRCSLRPTPSTRQRYFFTRQSVSSLPSPPDAPVTITFLSYKVNFFLFLNLSPNFT